MTKEISTLLPDIYEVLSSGNEEVQLENVEILLNSILSAIVDAVKIENDLSPRAELRLSKTGTPLRKVWYEHNLEFDKSKPIDPMELGPNLMRFLTGHITEAVLLFLAREAGHTVELEQATVEVEGVPGHLDAVIDGHLVDVKTASQFGYDKFKSGNILWGKDPFGYIPQLSAYRSALVADGVELKPTSYFWAYNKSNSEMCLTEVDYTHLVDAGKMLKAQKEVITQSDPPPRCYPEEDVGKAGNKKLGDQCKYCPFKFECFKDANGGLGLRVFKYSKGPEYLTEVVEKPKVEEIT